MTRVQCAPSSSVEFPFGSCQTGGMDYYFTPAICRAFREASRWRFSDRSEPLSAAAVLLGLLAEAESRAAVELEKAQVNEQAVHERWPEMQQSDSAIPAAREDVPWRFSADLRAAIASTVDRLSLFPQPLEIATEHLLLGLAAAQTESGQWLRGHGLDPDAMTSELFALYGVSKDLRPLECDELEIPDEVAVAELDYFNDPRKSRSPAAEAAAVAAVALDEDDPAPPTLSPREQVQVLRILDAASNRAREGLRVIEDFVRFVLDDAHLTRKLKQWRHDLTEVLKCIPLSGRMAARDTESDVGTTIGTAAEAVRLAPEDVLTANFKRLQESLRSLEEYGKLFGGELAARVEQLRYRTYTLHRAAAITRTSLDRLADVRLYVLLDGCDSTEEFEHLACMLIQNGVDAIQLRDKNLDDRTLLARARRLRELTRHGSTLFIVNDRPDIAVLSHADGVHVGQEELSAKDARTVVGPDALVGVSTHSIEQARQAVLSGANYIGVGPTFPSRTKEFDRFPGIALLDAVVSEIRLPAFAIGGIDFSNLSHVLGTGIRRVAVQNAILRDADPAAAARTLANRLRG